MATEKVERTDTEWRELLTPEQYDVLRRAAPSVPSPARTGTPRMAALYRCAGCGAELFRSETKFDSGTGWPSFYEPIEADAVELHEDTSYGMRRIEVNCARCGGHLGHVFPDGPKPTGQRYCMNSCSLDLERDEA